MERYFGHSNDRSCSLGGGGFFSCAALSFLRIISVSGIGYGTKIIY